MRSSAKDAGGWAAYRYAEEDEDEEEEVDAHIPHEEPEPEEHMFELDMLPNPWGGDSTFNKFAASNTIQVVSNQENRLVVIDGSEPTDHKIPLQQGENIHDIHLDPRGVHLLVSTSQGRNYYINTQQPPDKQTKSQVRPCAQLKGHVITAVGWDKRNNNNYQTSTGYILLGTTEGKIIEIRIDVKVKELIPLFKQQYDLQERASDQLPITGLQVEVFPTKMKKFFIMVTTPCRMYQFTGGPNFDNLFASLESTPSFNELPAMDKDIPCGELVFWHDEANVPKTFAWVTGVGIMHGRLVLRSSRRSDLYDDGDIVNIPEYTETEDVVQQTHIIPYPPFNDEGGMPISIGISEYHFYLLYSESVLILGHPPGLNWSSCSEPATKLKKTDVEARTDFKHMFHSSEGELGLYIHRDEATGQMFVVTTYGIHEFIVDNERRNVWRRFLERALDPNEREREAYFKKALKLCSDDPAQKETVLKAKGEFHFENGDFHMAAQMYAKTNQPFEETCLKFIEAKEPGALLHFLKCRLNFMKARAQAPTQEHSQFACLCTWVVEMYLDKLNNLQDVEAADERREVSEEFKVFLETHKEYLDPATTFNLISSHGQINEVLYFAELMEDYERVITHHIISNVNRDHKAAIRVLTDHGGESQYSELWYQFSPVLIQHNPKELVDGWMLDERNEWIDCSKLIPALVKYNPKEHNGKGDNTNHAIRYLEWLINDKENSDMAMHNMLLQFYASRENEQQLLHFLQSSKSYDPKYALRLCLEANRLLACVHIYSAMGLYEDAVFTALKIDQLKLAQENANKPDDDDIQLKKKLWLEIAKFISAREGGVKAAIQLLKVTEYIKLEDILPFFPAFVRVEDFKAEIRQSLEDYNAQIKDIKFEMDEATKNSNTIRQQISSLRLRYGYITAQQKCVLCKKFAMTKPVFIFPSCNHIFHQDCLATQVRQNLGDDAKGMSTEEFNDKVSSECMLCSEYMIAHVDRPFIENDLEAADWAITDD